MPPVPPVAETVPPPRRLTQAQLGVAPASSDVVKARDAAILEALDIRPRSADALLDVMPEEPGQTPEQKRTALSSALVRLRVKKQIDLVDGSWRRV